MTQLFIGIDLGTSGCRAYAIDEEASIIANSHQPLPESIVVNSHIVQKPSDWWQACQNALLDLFQKINRNQVKVIAIDGTSGTVLLCDNNGSPLTNGYMYNDSACRKEAEQIKAMAPDESGAHGASSGLSKCLLLLQNNKQANTTCLNQADWIAGNLLNRFDSSDENNALKMGYDPIKQEWPAWLNQLNCRHALPATVLQPGDVTGVINPEMAEYFGIPSSTEIIAGTTDSIAAFIATGSNDIGDAVTSLGSTLAIKLISDKPIFSPKYGVYSHRLGEKWLVGGASNTGGAVLKTLFSADELQQLSTQIDPSQPSELQYYPLVSAGERFPVNDPLKQPLLSPRPESDALFLHGLLESIAKIEKMAFDKLVELGAPYPTQIITMGGGSQNETWRLIRERICGIPVINANTAEAAFGTALLAKKAIT